MPARAHLRAQEKDEAGQRGAEGDPLEFHTLSFGFSSSAGWPFMAFGMSLRENR
jgi:hypothetical protein